MASITITVQSLLDSALYDSYTVDDTDTIGTLKTTIQTDTGVDPNWYVLVFDNNVLDDANTFASYSIIDGSSLRSGNVIGYLPTLQDRQLAKLDLATLDRIYESNPYTTYDINLLPSQYIGNVSTPNPHPDGLIQGRPWVIPAPVADFTATPLAGFPPLQVNFTETSTAEAPVEYEWDFNGDATIDSTEQNPSYVYTDEGTYSVTLTVTDPWGTDTNTKTDYVVVYANIVTSGLSMYLSASNPDSYPGTGVIWTDLSTVGADETLVGSPTYTAGPPGYISFDGVSQYAVGSTPYVIPPSTYTKIVWFQISGAADNNLVSSNAGGHFMYFAGTNTLFAGNANNPPYGPGGFGSQTSFNLDTWYCAAVVFNSPQISMYINGVLDNFDPTYGPAHSGDGSVNLGCFGPGGNLLNGKIGEVFCYSRSLTATEILQNFNATKANYGF